MKSYNNSLELKQKFIAELKKHIEQDKLIKGVYGDKNSKDFKGCAVGCSLHSLNIINGTNLDTSNHKRAELELGIPEWLYRLQDTIFEGLPKELSQTFPFRFSEAINVGSDLTKVKWQFCSYLMQENIDRVLSLNISEELKQEVVNSIRGVLTLHVNAIETGIWNDSAANLAADSAYSAARSAANLAANSAADSAYSAADLAAYVKYSEKLIELLKQTY